MNVIRSLSISLVVVVLVPFSAAAEPVSGGEPFEHRAFDDVVVPELEPDERAEFAADIRDEALSNFQNGAMETAARQLEVAYLLLGDVSLLFPLATALAEMGIPIAAAERIERFLERGGAAGDADRQAQAEALLVRLRDQFSSINVDSAPSGAAILLNGDSMGTAPLAAPLVLTRGAYELRAQLEGYQDRVERLVVEGGRELDLLLELDVVGALPPGGGNPDPGDGRTGLGAAFWATFGVTLASAAMTVVSFIVASVLTNDAQDNAARISTEERDTALNWWTTSWVFTGVTGAGTLTSILLGVL